MLQKNLSQSTMFILQLKCHYVPILLCHCVFTIKNPFNYFDFPIECSERSGAASGTCAAGFGVCCVFLTSSCGSTVKENCTYIRYLPFNIVILVVEFKFRITELWQQGLWNFQGRDTKIERFWLKIHCSQMKLLNFENRTNGEKSEFYKLIILILHFEVSNSIIKKSGHLCLFQKVWKILIM